MFFILRGSIIIFICVFIVGCATIPSQEIPSIWTTHYTNIPHKIKERVDLFGPGEKFALIIDGCSGMTATYQVEDLDSGKSVRRGTKTFPQGKIYCGSGSLPPGRYMALLYLEGSTVDSYVFTIEGEGKKNKAMEERQKDNKNTKNSWWI